MKALREAIDREWIWRRPELFRRRYELRAGDELVAVLESHSWLGRYMRAETAEGAWQLRHLGVWRGRMELRFGEESEPRAVFLPSWFGAGQAVVAGGAAYSWRRDDLWGRRWSFRDAGGNVQLTLVRQPSLLRGVTAVETTEAGRSRPELVELVLMSFFLLRLLERQMHSTS